MDNLQTGIARLHNICNQLHNNNSCLATTMQLNHLLSDIAVNNELLRPFNNEMSRRHKRGALNIVGNLANSLFGVLDSDYATKMTETIKNLKGNDEHLLQLMKNQTSIVDSTVNVMMNLEQSTHKSMQTLNVALNHTATQTNKIAKEVWEQEVMQTFSSAALQLLLSVNHYQKVQTSLLDILIDTHHGKFNPQLLAPQQLQQELSNIREELPPHLRVPTKSNDLLELYNIMTIEGRIMAEHIIFRLKLPLISVESFELFYIVPVPISANGIATAITTTLRYLIVNWDRDQYYPMPDQEVEHCHRTQKLNYVCRQRHPLYRIGSRVNACEMSFISHIPSKERCKMSKLDNPSRWIQLPNTNRWIYFFEDKEINIGCGTTVTQMTLSGSGIIELREGCTIREESLTIQAHQVFPSTINISFTPIQNLTEFVLPPHSSELSNDEGIGESLLKNLTELKMDLYNLQQREHLVTTILPKDVHHITIAYICLGGILTVVIYLYWKHRCRTSRNTTTKPIPLPRNLSTPAFTIAIDPE
ncbi:uncharacterized protein LOC119653958 [Hermetia illucens]|uniref:uncharacterized protein LOC119653958 n=1 Tax=Hermetia illucens TaxID=343691 RepID=UPI0018CBF70E|nr:uncharacterized protein LOC119653958 [Hermetia illucens]